VEGEGDECTSYLSAQVTYTPPPVSASNRIKSSVPHRFDFGAGSNILGCVSTRIQSFDVLIHTDPDPQHCFTYTYFRCRSLWSRLVSCAQCAASPRPTPASPAAPATAPSGSSPRLHSVLRFRDPVSGALLTPGSGSKMYKISGSYFQCCGTVTIYYGSGSGSVSDFWKVMVPVPVPVPTFEKLWFRFRFLLLKKLRFR
jgi:hypothetical protein